VFFAETVNTEDFPNLYFVHLKTVTRIPEIIIHLKRKKTMTVGAGITSGFGGEFGSMRKKNR